MRQSITKQLTAIKWWDGIIGKLDKNREREEEQKRKKMNNNNNKKDDDKEKITTNQVELVFLNKKN